MEPLTLAEISKAVSGEVINNRKLKVDKISIDSRTIEEASLFIAIEGDNFDGHNFLEAAISKGAIAAIVSQNQKLDLDIPLVKVYDTTKALQDLACYYRSKFDIPVVAVTGSTGKTTTKDMIASVLQTKYKTLKTEGNFNNEIGLPLTLFRLDNSYEAVVVEMGMRGLGQISELAEIALPNLGVITNVGLTHIELLGTVDNIAQAKSELIIALNKDGIAILNGDDNRVRKMEELTQSKVIKYGLDKDNDVKAGKIKKSDDSISFELIIEEKGYKDIINLAVPGEYNVYNSLAAITVAISLDIPLADIKTGLSNLNLSKMRNQIIVSESGYKIINDTYNANPTSMKAALNTLKDIAKENKIAVLGDMLELGDLAIEEHIKLGELVAEMNIEYLFSFGKLARKVAKGAKQNGMDKSRIFIYEDKDKLIRKLLEIVSNGDTILVKGSRGMKLEEVSQVLSDN
ncbi:UDP-N-acetylmuramoyl-tripeptide--D-alanyl-D-alanine ligase [Orenia marismortui]|uniref:UDP-N-acetylmuramoyl-tripeptide--D-alanyl-D-alanine ligase n=1 Tax=Orenia marismortui TaxID=46469 RepID=A0A4R8H0T6_9FIRM|nr:UDP-N-acetylmuramoyl-tripeptide--D-alanyl-D-alanine ligase [Orenia marismortui]TDX53018.1 UDP-N-acetylmuramoyl-tripeptide--D-alanyl-D-alanine ligase [Orenia marismortui]